MNIDQLATQVTHLPPVEKNKLFAKTFASIRGDYERGINSRPDDFFVMVQAHVDQYKKRVK